MGRGGAGTDRPVGRGGKSPQQLLADSHAGPAYPQNFVANIVDVQVELENPAHLLIAKLDYFFTSLFTVELFINLFAHWLIPFLRNGWNLVPPHHHRHPLQSHRCPDRQASAEALVRLQCGVLQSHERLGISVSLVWCLPRSRPTHS